ncbi:MAG: hypothetical protein KKF80_08160, partial [Candidatus Omnitrophica bacterium]|nr:hypothetical protein [Candidatus Omnitrophota bacterium]
MFQADFQRAKDLAEKVLNENEITSPPIPISLIAKNYGLKTSEYDFAEHGTKVAGMIDLSNSTIA